MEAYFNRKAIRLYLGDIIDILNQLLEESIDLIFADPPFLAVNSF